MSFEIFNYVPTLHEIERIILAVRERILTATRRQIDIVQLSGEAKRVMSGEEARLDAAIREDNEIVENLELIEDKINTLRTLPESVKAKLYNVYQHLGCSVGAFAELLPICYEGLLIDAVTIADKMNTRENVETLRDELHRVYKKYELMPLPRHYRWIAPDGML